ncbi:CD209 antigen-like protein E isoform X2 [Hippocampus zosterae]|uniref:CD209 antigen-like protein E isoform X2 n=1 Tax=Hippocampus zosterae TaxID=109293 RepID=UPI00223D922F|nr:CD209 antigen-like protein E isoform X2 [Hippocampus zosterae]
MAVVFKSRGSQVSIEVGEYEQIPENGHGDMREKRLPSKKEEICPQDWLQFNFSCYYISSMRKSWHSSRQDCLQRDADLVIINSREEQAFLTGFTKAAWIGMSDKKKEGIWIWVNGTPVNKDRLEWAPGQPDGAFGGEDCGDIRTMMNFIGLNDSNCSLRSQWICEKTLR